MIMLKQSAFDKERTGRSPAEPIAGDAALDILGPVLETPKKGESTSTVTSSKLDNTQTIMSESSALEPGVTKPRQRLNKLGASPEYNNAMKDIIKKSAEKKKLAKRQNRSPFSSNLARGVLALILFGGLYRIYQYGSLLPVTSTSSPPKTAQSGKSTLSTSKSSSTSPRSAAQRPTQAATKEIIAQWPSWAPPKSQVERLLPQVDDASELVIQADEEKRDAVREAFKWSWDAYEQNAWGADEYHPISQTGSFLTSNERGMGYTIVDSLDSLLLMGFDEEYERAREWVREELSFNVPGKVNGFETIIRILGGLLAAYHLTSSHANPAYHPDSQLYLTKAIDLADRLLPIFDSPSGIPYSFIDLAARRAYPDMDNGGMSSLAEAGTMQLEFKYLSEISGNDVYAEKAEHVMELLDKQMPGEGVAPILLNPETGKFAIFDIRLGSRGDSYYEYLLKQWIQTNRTEPVYRKMYDRSMKGIEQILMNKSAKQGLIFTHELGPQKGRGGIPEWMIRPKQDHLVCFLGGSMLLGVASSYPNNRPVWSAMTPSQQIDYVAGTGLIETCVETYEGNPTGLAAEIVIFRSPKEVAAHRGNKDWYIKRGLQDEPVLDGRNILRPETIESLFLAYRLTGDQKYRDQGWRMFQAFDLYCRMPEGGYAGIADVENGMDVENLDKMETFWLSETLKYFYLLFSDGETVPLDENVFNTEAHILPIFTPRIVSAFASTV